ncbi:glycosyltransferase family 4 protein [Streptomyces daliensis]
MSRPPTPLPLTSVGQTPPHAVQVLGGGSADTGTHVRSLTAGLVARGLRVTVCAPGGAELSYGFTATGASFAPAPARSEPEAVAALRRVCEDADVVHAHGLQAGLLAALALRRRRRHVPLVVTWHTRGHARGARARLTRMLERRVARSATVVLGVSSDLVARARRRGARDARLAPVAALRPSAVRGAKGAGAGAEPSGTAEERLRHKVRAEVGAVDRPLIVSVGRLAEHQGYDAALTASRAWRHFEPPPLFAIAGEGAERAALQRRIDEEDLPVRLLGRREDALQLLAGADVAVLASRWEARSLFAQEALRAGVPLVATAVGGVPELVGDAALLVPYAAPDALATAVTSLLTDPPLRASLVAKGHARAASWPSENDTVTQILALYDELTLPSRGAE